MPSLVGETAVKGVSKMDKEGIARTALDSLHLKKEIGFRTTKRIFLSGKRKWKMADSPARVVGHVSPSNSV